MRSREKAQSFLEAILAVGIFLLVAGAILTLTISALTTGRQAGEVTKAYLASDAGAEIARNIRDQAWNKLAYADDGQTHGLVPIGGVWGFSGENNTFDKYTRSIEVEGVARDANGDIGEGDNDLETKKVTVTTDWSFLPTRANSVPFVLYLTNWYRSLWTETTVADFSDGLFDLTEVTNEFDGELRLIATGLGPPTWRCPARVASVDFSTNSDARGVVVANDESFVVTDNNPGGDEFYILDVADTSNPTVTSSLDLGGAGHDVVLNESSYAYIASANNSQALQVVDISDTHNPSIAGFYNISGGSDALTVAVSGDYVYLGTENRSGGSSPEFFVLDISTPTAPVLSGSLEIGSSIHDLYFEDDLVYLATSDDAAEFQIIDVSDKLNPLLLGFFDTPTVSDGRSVLIDSNVAYFATDANSSMGEFYSLEVTDPASISQLGNQEIGGNALSIILDASHNFAFVGNGESQKELKVVDISDPSTLQLEQSVNANGDLTGLSQDDNIVYASSIADGDEFQVFESQEGGSWSCVEKDASADTSGGQDASDVFVTPANNRLYLITTNNTAGEELYIFDIANSTTPLELSSLNIGSGGHSVVVKDNYAYLATSDNSSELMIIDIQDPTSLAVNAIYNAPSSSDAYDVVVAGNYAYLATSNNPGGTPEIYILDVSDPLVPSLVGSYNVGADVYGLFYRDDLLYLATSENNAELQILDVSNKAVPSSLGGYNTPGGEEGREIVIDENEVAYLLTDNDPGSDAEFFVLDVTNPASISVLSSTDIGKGGRALFVIDEYAFVGTEAAGNQVQIFDVSDPADPQEVNSWDISALVNGIFVQEDTLYMATSDNTEELQIWSQVAGGTVGYQVQGSYESSVFGPVSNFNLIKWSEAVPSGTDLRVQIKTAPDASGSPGAWSETWCGPEGEDADETDYFTDASGGIIHPDHVGDNWIKYKLTLTSDGTITPSLEDITVNYKP